MKNNNSRNMEQGSSVAKSNGTKTINTKDFAERLKTSWKMVNGVQTLKDHCFTSFEEAQAKASTAEEVIAAWAAFHPNGAIPAHLIYQELPEMGKPDFLSILCKKRNRKAKLSISSKSLDQTNPAVKGTLADLALLIKIKG